MGVASNSPGDAELEALLTRLLRIISPAVNGATGAIAADDDGARRVVAAGPARSRSAGDGAAGSAAAGSAAAGAGAGRLPAVSVSEARALIELVSARGIAQGELGALLGLEKSTVSRLAAGLERKGWVRRGRDTANQRYLRLYLTAEGRDVAARLWQAWHSRQARVLAGLSAEERAGLAAGLRGLVRGLAAEGLRGAAEHE